MYVWDYTPALPHTEDAAAGAGAGAFHILVPPPPPPIALDEVCCEKPRDPRGPAGPAPAIGPRVLLPCNTLYVIYIIIYISCICMYVCHAYV